MAEVLFEGCLVVMVPLRNTVTGDSPSTIGHKRGQRISLTELAGKVGITLANLSILKTGKAKAVRFSTLEAICRELRCQPGDILEYVPGPTEESQSDVPYSL